MTSGPVARPALTLGPDASHTATGSDPRRLAPPRHAPPRPATPGPATPDLVPPLDPRRSPLLHILSISSVREVVRWK